MINLVFKQSNKTLINNAHLKIAINNLFQVDPPFLL